MDQTFDAGAHDGDDHLQLVDGVFPEAASAAFGFHVFRMEFSARFDEFRSETECGTGKERGAEPVGARKKPFRCRAVRSERLVDEHRLSGGENRVCELFVFLRIGGGEHAEDIACFDEFFL